ncbi:type II toxin-antitoxin system HicB family antitoxin [Billgrantia tianxiuensis]|jgi:predicted HicB family RNase H-like nuclease|uniref:Type II toxin-antitoxin system HicB family antitoxin n=1 Tax=Billgrantia tianxiuensis TaxID=2497861 RepID=A0A6I6SV11_9GAMM|nr:MULTISPECIES: type II toxin-antitoxin system HicB family antitoxin [Halomonas]MCE8035342.1 type II toxin-antitoxin system HicB family antitoxin [Halomonas sp. MCCC 1A11057]QHC51855.1 type II toxin-antitoxin system HicB family antitoxin [Halomonas tianxiuensis]
MKANVLEYKGYQGSIEVSLEDNVLHGKILHIVDLVTFEARTPEGLREAFEQEVDEYLAFCEEEGVAPDKPFSGTFNVRVGPDIHKRLAMAASRAGKSLNVTVTQVLEKWLDDCPQGFEVLHRHTHEHRVVRIDDEYMGAMALTTRKAPTQPKVLLQ